MVLEMEPRIDFLQHLDIDVSVSILMCLDDSADLIRASTVSQFWRAFVFSYGLCKLLCVRRFPQLVDIDRLVEPTKSWEICAVEESANVLWDICKEEQIVYARLLRALTTFPLRYCIKAAISASSTDQYPDESVENTLDPTEIMFGRGSYWSSKGCDDSEMVETLIYQLDSDFCLITEIKIQPFQAFFQRGSPVYSSKFVRFRFGQAKSLRDNLVGSQECADEKFIWTYTSEKFAVAQENHLQSFELPEPALCIGGYLQIELLGSVQKQRADSKYYICVCRVEAVGRPLHDSFNIGIRESPDQLLLEYNSKIFDTVSQGISSGSINPTLPPKPDWSNLENNVAGNAIYYEWGWDEEEEILEVEEEMLEVEEEVQEMQEA